MGRTKTASCDWHRPRGRETLHPHCRATHADSHSCGLSMESPRTKFSRRFNQCDQLAKGYMELRESLPYLVFGGGGKHNLRLNMAAALCIFLPCCEPAKSHSSGVLVVTGRWSASTLSAYTAAAQAPRHVEAPLHKHSLMNLEPHKPQH